MNLSIENKQINPGVINLTQFSSGTDILTFQLESSIYEGLDFKDEEFTAYAIAILPNGKIMDKIELSKKTIDNKLQLEWKVTNYTTQENGTLTYQIVFQNTNQNVVWYSNNALMFVNSSIDVDDFLTAHYPTLLQQWLLKMEQLKVLIQECTGLPVAGNEGQILSKKTDEDFDCEWMDLKSILSNIEAIKTQAIFPTKDRAYDCGTQGNIWRHVYSNEYNLPKRKNL